MVDFRFCVSYNKNTILLLFVFHFLTNLHLQLNNPPNENIVVLFRDFHFVQIQCNDEMQEALYKYYVLLNRH